jgi:hypothetical protein
MLHHQAVLAHVMAKSGVDGDARETSVSDGTTTEDGDGGVGYSACADQWICLGGSWVKGACVGERR